MDSQTLRRNQQRKVLFCSAIFAAARLLRACDVFRTTNRMSSQVTQAQKKCLWRETNNAPGLSFYNADTNHWTGSLPWVGVRVCHLLLSSPRRTAARVRGKPCLLPLLLRRKSGVKSLLVAVWLHPWQVHMTPSAPNKSTLAVYFFKIVSHYCYGRALYAWILCSMEEFVFWVEQRRSTVV